MTDSPQTAKQIWNMVLGPHTSPADALAEADQQSITPQDYLRSALDEAISQGLEVDTGRAYQQLCETAGVADS